MQSPAVPGRGKTATVEVGIADSARFDVFAFNNITINFYKAGGSPFHEVRYGYERIWCRRVSAIGNLWKRAYPEEKGSKYSINSARTISRLCMKE